MVPVYIFFQLQGYAVIRPGLYDNVQCKSMNNCKPVLIPCKAYSITRYFINWIELTSSFPDQNLSPLQKQNIYSRFLTKSISHAIMIKQESYFVHKVWIILVTQIKNYIFWVFKNHYPDYYYKDLYAIRIAKLSSSFFSN